LVDQVTAARLRMSLASVRDLRDALDKILLMAAVPPTQAAPG
jgi:hypothetical protein